MSQGNFLDFMTLNLKSPRVVNNNCTYPDTDTYVHTTGRVTIDSRPLGTGGTVFVDINL